MPIGSILKNIGRDFGTGAKRVGAASLPILKSITNEESGEDPQIHEKERQRKQELQDAAINTRANYLESQLAMGEKYGTLTPDQQKQTFDELVGLYSHPSQMGTLMERFHRALHPNGTTYQPQAEIPNATPKGGTAGASVRNAITLADAKEASKPLPKNEAFLQSYAATLGKTWNELTPDEMVDAFNLENQTQAAKDKQKHQNDMDNYRDASTKLRAAKLALQTAQFDASQNPNSPVYKLNLEKARTQEIRAQSYWVNAQARAFGEVGGHPLPGAVLTAGGHPIGSSFAPQYVKSSQAMAQLNDAGGAINIVGNALQNLYAAGGSLTDPIVAQALANHEWTAAQVAQGIVGQALTPVERNAVTAIISARENIQGMRKSAGGGLSNEQVNRLEAQLPGANTPNQAYASRQLGLLGQTLQRLSEGVPATVGGYTFEWSPENKEVGKLGKLTKKTGAKHINAQPKRPAGVPENAVWNPNGNGGKGAWQLSQ